MSDLLTWSALSIVAVGFLVGTVVGLTGMGGGALMTPALILLGFADASAVVTADLTAAAVYKSGAPWSTPSTDSPTSGWRLC